MKTEIALRNPNQDEMSGRYQVYYTVVESDISKELFYFMASCSVIDNNSKEICGTFRHIFSTLKDWETKLELSKDIDQLKEKSEFVQFLIKNKGLDERIILTLNDVYTFLREVSLFEKAGIIWRIPNWWKGQLAAMSISLDFSVNRQSYLSKNEISVTPHLIIDGEELTEEEISDILSRTDGLAYLKGRWVEVNHARLREALEICRNYGPEGLTTISAMRKTFFSPPCWLDIEVSNKEWLQEFLHHSSPGNSALASPPESFCGELLPYQVTGFNWLIQLYMMECGACLADDMGLGKTPQTIAYLEWVRTNYNGRVLLVVPKSLLGNWQQELERFAPSMSYRIVHDGPVSNCNRSVQEPFLTITTYRKLMRQSDLLEAQWDIVILDEAQAIKNRNVQQTKCVKTLHSKMRVVLTGTPIENKLDELWSLFDFINPGLLGMNHEFSQLVGNPAGITKLREIVSPFILRRLKTDKTVISDLPSKREIVKYVELSKEQVVLYNKEVDDFEAKWSQNPKDRRVGLILVLISKLKQICNHPDQYLGLRAFNSEEGGKFVLLKTICKQIAVYGQKVLVFTQYREMTEPLNRLLESIFGSKGIVVHGGITSSERTRLVKRFQTDGNVRFAVMTIKTGGVGLNLTAACNVIHFDLWWNPAVESQATDRVHRIGQKIDVDVYRFVCKNTLEERINMILAGKRELAKQIIDACDVSWLATKDIDELMQLFRLCY